MRSTATQEPNTQQRGDSLSDRTPFGTIMSGTLRWGSRALALIGLVSSLLMIASVSSPLAFAQQAPAPTVQQGGGEANLVLPDLGSVDFMGVNGRSLLMIGLVVCAFGMLFGLVISKLPLMQGGFHWTIDDYPFSK